MKKLLFIVLAISAGLVSCQKEKIGDTTGLVDVAISGNQKGFDTKTEVTSNGATNWNMNDQVIIVDVDENRTARVFTSTLDIPSSTSGFSGKLLGGQGIQTYYAYYSALESPCVLKGQTITVGRNELLIECNDNTNATSQGNYCSMVAIPATFDVSDPLSTKKIEFKHIGCLLEARISGHNGDFLNNLVFDKVEFKMTAIKGEAPYTVLDPFNTEVTIDMSKIATNAAIPYTETGKKINSISSVIIFKEPVNFKSRYTSGTSHFDIPIYALPTKDYFTYQYDIFFYNGSELVCALQRKGVADGLNLSGINTPSFSELTHMVFPVR